jgi:hypothetical protein
MALGLTQPLIEMSTRIYFSGVKCCKRVRLTASSLSKPTLGNMEFSMSHNPIGFHSLLQGEHYFLTFEELVE